MADPTARDQIVFRDMVLPCRVGALPGESDVPQPIRLRLRLTVDLATAGRSDRLEDTVDYGAVAETVAAIVERGPYELLETVASRIVDAALENERVQWAEVEVEKVQPPLPDSHGKVAILISRRRGERL